MSSEILRWLRHDTMSTWNSSLSDHARSTAFGKVSWTPMTSSSGDRISMTWSEADPAIAEAADAEANATNSIPPQLFAAAAGNYAFATTTTASLV